MRVLVVNAGSSSLKLRLLDADNSLLAAEDWASEHGFFDLATARAAIQTLADQADAVGHRVVHGGTRFTESVVIDDAVDRELRDLTALAPLHQPKSLAGIDVVHELLPELPAVACFDTAFHTHMPAEAATYAVPEDWRERLGVRRFGFHGLSHQYASRRAADLIGRPVESLRIVTCHLGAGASLAAVVNARSVDTTMGFTPLEGLVMATRSGTVDPGLVTWLVEHADVPVDDVSDALEHRSGVLALAGTADMAMILNRARDGDGRSQLALDVYVHKLRAGIASMASAMNGIDLLVFTGGVGEHAPTIRSRAVQGLAFLGAALDEEANLAPHPDTELTDSRSAFRIAVVAAREDIQIASEVRSLLSPGRSA
jgi:acetate kinase